MAIQKHLIIDILAVIGLVSIIYRLTVSEKIFDMPLIEIGMLAFRCLQYLTLQITDPISQIPEIYSIWFYAKVALTFFGGYFFYAQMIRPLNRVRAFGELGYIPENGLSMKEMANAVRKRRLAGDVPPVYPNGWFVVLESRDLKVGESKAVSCLGKVL